MPSPFPGMDPWLEAPALFPDLHNTFITFLRGELNRRLPPPFRAAIVTRVYMEVSERMTEPDVDVLTPADAPPSPAPGEGYEVQAVATLIEVPATSWPSEEVTEAFIEIRTTDGDRRLVTGIELLSPNNKTPGTNGRAMYQAKQRELALAGVNLVEIDLLRRGAHATAVSAADLRRRHGRYDDHVCITRADRERTAFVAAILLPQSLPVIQIPLTPDHPGVPADFQAILNRSYEDACYDREVNYAGPCDPPLTPEQQAWAEGVLRAKGILS
jgi:hypothetical protein